MKQHLLFSICLLFSLTFLNGQTVILDFETPETSTDFQYFGSSLEATLSSVIANPDPSGINTSANVVEFTKPAGSEVWAGGFSNPDPTIPIDASSGGELCVKIWTAVEGNLNVKLEQGTGPDWILQVDNSVTEEWVDLCFNLADFSLEAPFEQASGVYNRIVLFTDFGVSPTEDRIYYIDDVILYPGQASEVDVTFNVDMNEYDGTLGTVFVAGEFNGWTDANPMEDPDGDGVYSATLSMLTGSYEYIFMVDNFTDTEEFAPGSACTVTDPSGEFTNRLLVLDDNTVLDPVCWESCAACGDEELVLVTFNVGTSHIDVDPTGLFIAGGAGFGVPGDNLLEDPDGDGVYSITFEVPLGYSDFYTFANGSCPDFSCKENIAGQDCANPDNFNDRFLDPVTENTVINTCFGICTTDTNCEGGGQPGNITFQVDVSDATDPFTEVYVSGSLNGWSGTANPMTDLGNGIWEATIPLDAGQYEYKFTFDDFAVQETFAGGEDCTLTTGEFVNRVLDVDGDNSFCFQWNTCDACIISSTKESILEATAFSLRPSVTQYSTQVVFEQQLTNKVIQVLNINGQVVFETGIEAGANMYELNTAAFASGMYVVVLRADEGMSTERLIKE